MKVFCKDKFYLHGTGEANRHDVHDITHACRALTCCAIETSCSSAEVQIIGSSGNARRNSRLLLVRILVSTSFTAVEFLPDHSTLVIGNLSGSEMNMWL